MEYLLGVNELNQEVKINVTNSNIFIGGSAGTGKSFLIHKIIKSLENELNNSLKLCIIDTKIVEFHKYKNSNYLYLPNGQSEDEIKNIIQHLYDIIKQKDNDRNYKILFIVEDFSDFYYMLSKKNFNLFLNILKHGKEYGIYTLVSTQNTSIPFCNEDLIKYFDNIICFELISEEDYIRIIGSSKVESLEFQKEAMIKNKNEINKIRLID